MIVIGIKEDDFTILPLIDPEIEELKYPEYPEKTLKPKVVGCAKWKYLTLAESSKRKPSQIQFTADESVRISDYVIFIAGSANKGTDHSIDILTIFLALDSLYHFESIRQQGCRVGS